MKIVEMEIQQGESTKSSKQIDDAWSMPLLPFSKEDNPHGLLCESSFAIVFPKYREKYIRECWPLVKNALSEHHIKAELDVIEGSMTVFTTRKTWDPYVVLKARDMVKLIGRGVPYEQAIRVLADDVGCDIIKIRTLVRNRERFIKRRKRLIGPKGATLKSMELLTKCYVLVQGNTVAALGPHKGLQHVRKIVEETMKNIHPVYNLNALFVKEGLAKNPVYKNKSWDQFLPKFSSKNISKRKQPKKINHKKEYTPFPPPQLESKVDQQLATGEYFLKEKERKTKQLAEKNERKVKAEMERQQKRNEIYIPPVEQAVPKGKPKSDTNVDIEKLKNKVKSLKKKGFKREAVPQKSAESKKKRKREIH